MMPLLRVLKNSESVEFEDKQGQYRVLYKGEAWEDSHIFALIAACPALKEDPDSLAEIVFFLFLQQHHNQITHLKHERRFIYRLPGEGGDLEEDKELDVVSDVFAKIHPPLIRNGVLEFCALEKDSIPGEVPQPVVVRVPLNGPRVTWARAGAEADAADVVTAEPKEDKKCILM